MVISVILEYCKYRDLDSDVMFGIACVTGCLVLGTDWVSKPPPLFGDSPLLTGNRWWVVLNGLAGVEGHSF